MNTKLVRFKVENFRSIEQSDWTEVSDNSCLVGTNESGKTNLLLALWKLNPANYEPIVPLDDFPRSLFSNYKAGHHEYDVFISADFKLEDSFARNLASELDCDYTQTSTVLVSRQYNGKYKVSLPYTKIEEFPAERLTEMLSSLQLALNNDEAYTKSEPVVKQIVDDFIKEETENIKTSHFKHEFLKGLAEGTNNLIETKFGQKKNLPNLITENFKSQIDNLNDSFEGNEIELSQDQIDSILEEIPKFVYYSDYGNLDSEIFLPRVIEDFERTDLGETARAKVRTLQVLFKYLKLSPNEIFELGNDREVIIRKVNNQGGLIDETTEELTDEEIQQWSNKKRERGILLRSAATQLTQNFKKWWLQGDYIFDFQADGNHFRINVSDSIRPEQIELEGRSRGLQWFFSFFLVFLVETKEGLANTILLLDEPGLSLHPLAQYDLAKFFRKLSEDNQLVYTSHSPFLVDIDNLANLKAVYVDKESGRTKITSNLRYDEKDAEKSIYPVHAALGLTVSDTLLLGCKPILVEGTSDQIYLSFLKLYLQGEGLLKFSKEFVFIPVGGVRGMSPVSKLVSSRDNELPMVLLDSDKAGREYKKNLINGKYKGEADKVLEVNDFLEGENYEIEDLIPPAFIIKSIDRSHRADEYFEDFYKEGIAIVDQIEQWAENNEIDLVLGWKVELSRDILNRKDKFYKEIDDKTKETWNKLFIELVK